CENGGIQKRRWQPRQTQSQTRSETGLASRRAHHFSRGREPMNRPRAERIALMRERVAEIGRAVGVFREGLRQTNAEHHQAFFGPVLDRIGLIVVNERHGVTTALADDLANARSALRRLPLPDLDPDLDEPTPSLWRLRGDRGNLVEALDNAL